MSYIGNQSENKVAPSQLREYLAPNGSATYFDLGSDVPGYASENLMVMVNNVIQEPAVAYTVINDANGRPRRLNFGVALATTDTAYVIHQGMGTLYHTPPTNSVGYAQLEANLRSGRVDQFAGSAGTSVNTIFTLTETALNANSINVFINGIYQRPNTNYTVVGTALTFTSSLADADELDVHHLSIRSTHTEVQDGSITTAKLDTNLTVAGTLTVSTPSATGHAVTKAYSDLKAPLTGATFSGAVIGTTIDATTDFTVGGTVITDNTITDDGTLVIASTTATSFSEGNITNVGDIALDTISSDAGTSIGVTLGTDAGDDFNVGSNKLIVEGDTGNVFLGTTGIATATFQGFQNSTDGGGGGNYLSHNTSGDATRNWNFGMNGVDQFVVYGYRSTSTFNSGVYVAWGGASWTAQSDERKKDIIEPISDALNKVNTLRAVIGKYKTDADDSRRSFLIAQDVQAVLPEAVDASDPDDLGVQYTEVIPLLVASIKELSAKNDALEARILALETT